MTKEWLTKLINRGHKESKGARGSGRTRNMLQRALATALEGRTVYVVADSQPGARSRMMEMRQLPEMKELFNVHMSMQSGDMQLPSGQVRFRSADDPNFDWRILDWRGMPPGVPTFIDHYTWESMIPGWERARDLLAKEGEDK